MSSSSLARILILSLAFIFAKGPLFADPIREPNPSETVDLDLIQPIASSPNELPPLTAQVSPGSQVEFTLNISALGSPAALHAFSFDFSNPELIDPIFTAALPSGWTYSLTDTSFSAENLSGSDLPPTDSATPLGTFAFTVDPNTPVGTEFDLTALSNVNLQDADGNAIVSQSPVALRTEIDVIPEPPVFWLILAAALGCAPFWIRQSRLP